MGAPEDIVDALSEEGVSRLIKTWVDCNPVLASRMVPTVFTEERIDGALPPGDPEREFEGRLHLFTFAIAITASLIVII